MILDNFANSHPEVLNRLERITSQPVICSAVTMLDRPFVEAVLAPRNRRRAALRWSQGGR